MIIKRKASHNKIEYQMYRDLGGMKFIPRLIESNDEFDTFDVVNSKPRTKVLNKEELVALTVMLKFLHNQAKFKLGGEAYLNNNLTMDNIAFNENGTPIQIIDWSKCSVGDGINDLLMLIDSFIDLKEERYSHKEAYDRIITIGQFYNSCHLPLRLGSKMKEFYETRIVESEMCCMEKDAMKKLEFTEKYLYSLNEI